MRKIFFLIIFFVATTLIACGEDKSFYQEKSFGGYYNIYNFTDLEIDNEGNVFILSPTNAIIYKYKGTSINKTIDLKRFANLKINKEEVFFSSYFIDMAIYNNKIYLLDRRGLVVTCSTEGNYITAWGSCGNKDGELYNPAGITCDAMGNVYVVDAGNKRIQKFNSNGEFLMKWPIPFNYGIFNSCKIGISTKKANIYLINPKDKRVIIYNGWTGQEIKTFYINGKNYFHRSCFSSYCYDMEHPFDLDINDKGNILYISEGDNNCVRVFNTKGEQNEVFGKNRQKELHNYNKKNIIFPFQNNIIVEKGTGKGEFDRPLSIKLFNNKLYVLDSKNRRLQILSDNGDYISEIEIKTQGYGRFSSPVGLSCSKGFIYVLDKGNDRIQKFDSNGNFIRSWGQFGNDKGEFINPEEISVDSYGNIYVSDMDYNKNNYTIQITDNNGRYLNKLSFKSPFLFRIKNNSIFIIDKTEGVIKTLSLKGDVISSFSFKKDNRYIYYFSGDFCVTDKYIYISWDDRHEIHQHDLSGRLINIITTDKPYEKIVEGMNGNPYVFKTNEGLIREYTPDGKLLNSLYLAEESQIDATVIDSANEHFYILDGLRNKIYLIKVCL